MFFEEPLSGSQVRFRLASAACPDAKAIVDKITDQLDVTGKVLYLSDSGDQKSHFAIVDVPGIMSPVVVPVDRVQLCHESAGEVKTETQK
ncbi:MAG: hypothetical protein JW936_11540 [Sedimentisphaerales bacterium]|nr:hypothetical protein [Sedimentisphaerales bacterium]